MPAPVALRLCVSCEMESIFHSRFRIYFLPDVQRLTSSQRLVGGGGASPSNPESTASWLLSTLILLSFTDCPRSITCNLYSKVWKVWSRLCVETNTLKDTPTCCVGLCYCRSEASNLREDRKTINRYCRLIGTVRCLVADTCSRFYTFNFPQPWIYMLIYTGGVIKENGRHQWTPFGKFRVFHFYGMLWRQFERVFGLHKGLRWRTDEQVNVLSFTDKFGTNSTSTESSAQASSWLCKLPQRIINRLQEKVTKSNFCCLYLVSNRSKQKLPPIFDF